MLLILIEYNICGHAANHVLRIDIHLFNNYIHLKLYHIFYREAVKKTD